MIRTYVLLESQRFRHDEGYQWSPWTDVYQCGGDVVVRLEAAGMGIEDFRISADGQNRISISGQRFDRSRKDVFLQMEIPFGDFQVNIELPPRCHIDTARLQGRYENGFLFIRCPVRRSGRASGEEKSESGAYDG